MREDAPKKGTFLGEPEPEAASQLPDYLVAEIESDALLRIARQLPHDPETERLCREVEEKLAALQRLYG